MKGSFTFIDWDLDLKNSQTLICILERKIILASIPLCFSLPFHSYFIVHTVFCSNQLRKHAVVYLFFHILQQITEQKEVFGTQVWAKLFVCQGFAGVVRKCLLFLVRFG